MQMRPLRQVKAALSRLAASIGIATVLFVPAAVAEARVTHIVIDDQQPLSSSPGYQQISGRAFGELDPSDPLNAIIQDISLGADPDGKVRYVASFVLTLPTDLAQASGMLWHDVPNRGTPITIGAPQPLTTIPVQICLKDGFDPTKLYQVVYTARDPYVLGVGFAAWRDVGAFFKYEAQDDLGNPNPIAGAVKWSIARGSSQSGNFL